jgi:DNA repair exonuclease SbcCD ATPase subunit
MRITKASFRNWGPHKSLDLDMDSPVYGFLGENGCGKTNLLEGLGFCFTGKLERDQILYAREVGGVRTPNGSVEVHFNKDGMIGKIFRQVGTSPRRWMEWDGVKYTKSADIDRILQEILDCDKKAVDMAVFLSQGCIGDFLFTTASVREDMFAKLTLIDHLSGVADIAAQRAVELGREVVDLTSVRDEAVGNVQSALDTLRAEEEELKNYPDQTPYITWLNNWIQKQTTLNSVRSQLQRQSGLVQAAVTKQGQRVRPAYLPADSTAESALEREQTLLGGFETASQQLSDTRRRLESRTTDDSNLKNMDARHRALIAAAEQLPTLQTEVAAITKEIQITRDYLVAWNASQALAARHQTAQAAVTATQNALAALPEFSVLDVLEEAVKKEMDILGPLGLGLKLAQQVEGKVKDACCPLCKSTDLSKLPSGEVLASQVADFKVKYATVTDNQKLYATQRSNRQLLTDQLVPQKLALNAVNLDMSLAPPMPPASAKITNPQELTAAENDLRTKERQLAELTAQQPVILDIEKAILDLSKTLSSYEPEADLKARIQSLESSLQGREAAGQRVSELKTYIAGAAADLAEVTKEKNEFTRLEGEVQTAVNDLEGSRKFVPGGIEVLTLDDYQAVQAQLDDRKQKQTSRTQQEGKITACTEALRRAEGRVSEVDGRIQGNARTREVINQLEQIREAFSRSGIPRHYLTQVFESLVEGTQENLANWDSDFQVERDELKLFNFRFYRSNDPETIMDQSQLSGGQKMRLSISFLLAVQQLVMPELGFIVLDEPTYGLDPAGIEGLATLFRHMAVHLADVNSQVVVVTHEALLKPALAKSITLRPVSEMQEGVPATV